MVRRKVAPCLKKRSFLGARNASCEASTRVAVVSLVFSVVLICSTRNFDNPIHVLLHLNKAMELAFVCEKFLVSTDFGNFAFFEHHKTCRITKCAEAMSDSEGGSAFDQPCDSVLNLFFGVGIHRSCGFIENQYSWVVQNCAGDADSLALTAAERLA